MSIKSTHAATPVKNLAASQEMRNRSESQKEAECVQDAGVIKKTDVTLSALVKQIQTDSSQDIDFTRVAKIKSALEAGELPVDADKIAGALVRSMFESF